MNAPWTWTGKLSLQHEALDATHQEFVALCAALQDEKHPQSFVERLDDLIQHSVAHFEQENQWMRETDFPSIGCHLREHETVLEIMREVRARYEEGDHELGQRLAEELPHWFENHVDAMDSLMVRHLKNHDVTTCGHENPCVESKE